MNENVNIIGGEEVTDGSLLVLAGLAIVGVSAIMGLVGFGIYKIQEKIVDKAYEYATRKAGLKAGRKAKEEEKA